MRVKLALIAMVFAGLLGLAALATGLNRQATPVATEQPADPLAEAWGIYQTTEAEGLVIAATGRPPPHDLIERNAAAWQRLLAAGAIVQLAWPDMTVARQEGRRWPSILPVWPRGVQEVLPLASRLGGQRAPGITWVRAVNLPQIQAALAASSRVQHW